MPPRPSRSTIRYPASRVPAASSVTSLSSSAAERVHASRARGDALVELMDGRLLAHRRQEDVPDGGLAAAAADRRLHVELVVVQETEVELAVGGEPHAVAGAAVGLAHGRDEAHDPGRALEPPVARLVGAVAGDRREPPELALDPRLDRLVGDELLARDA